MPTITVGNAAKQAFIPLMRELVRTYQAFDKVDNDGLRTYNITQSQADVLFTLGNTQGLTFKEIGCQTLITKGTLTGVIDRLEKKGLVKRIPGSEDRRCIRVVLTGKGKRLFADIFPQHIAYLKKYFDKLSCNEVRTIERALQKLHSIFQP